MAQPQTTPRILVVDDEPSIRFFLQETLERDGYQVVAAERPSQALRLAAQTEFDLALLDLQMPEMDGLTLLANLRSQCPDMGVIILTAHATVETAVRAIRFGAYDYLFKPCQVAELRRSVRAGLEKQRQQVSQRNLVEHVDQLERSLLNSLADIRATTHRRSQPVELPPAPPDAPQPDAPQVIGELALDAKQHLALIQGRPLPLSPTEFSLLAYLVEKYPQVVPAQELLAQMRSDQTEPWEAAELIRYHIYRIRQKIRRAGGPVELLRTVRGVGYTLAP